MNVIMRKHAPLMTPYASGLGKEKIKLAKQNTSIVTNM